MGSRKSRVARVVLAMAPGERHSLFVLPGGRPAAPEDTDETGEWNGVGWDRK